MQTTIYTNQSLGINGQISKAESQYLSTFQGVLMQDTAIGKAVGVGTKQDELIATGLTTDNFLGFIVRDGFINACETPTETYKKGDTATVITKGSIFIKAPAIAKQGQYVVCSATGALTFADTATAGTNLFLTGWRVGVGGAKDEIIEITTGLK